ncbi:hypothetical protein D046_2875, partial [Vibrio parahaemolyticus V-223/04]
GTKQRDY